MDLFQRAHHFGKEDGKAQHVAVLNLPMGREHDRVANDRDVKKPFVHRLEPIEPRHRNAVLGLALRTRRGCALDPRDFERVSVRRADIFEAAQLLDHGAVEPFLGLKQRAANSFLGSDLPHRDQDRDRDDADHDKTDAPILVKRRAQGETRDQDGRHEIAEADAEKFHEALDAARNAAVQ